MKSDESLMWPIPENAHLGYKCHQFLQYFMLYEQWLLLGSYTPVSVPYSTLHWPTLNLVQALFTMTKVNHVHNNESIVP